MKIAFLLPYFTIVSGSYGGIKMQAMQWRDELLHMGHDVIEINPWDTYDWKSFDAIHFFYFGSSYFTIYRTLKDRAPQAKIICSPVLDPHFPMLVYQILSRIAFPKAKIFAEYSALRKFENVFDLFLARTEFEKKFLSRAFGVPSSKIEIVPLNSRFSPSEKDIPQKKEPFCLHVSRISDKTKNVERLVKAALKYKFRLVLAGASTDEFIDKVKKLTDGVDNIQILGRISDEQLIELYKRAKVFALPSIREGVGLVALEAASYGCDIVITNIAGPKEYFLPYSIAVDPYNIDEIGTAVSKFMQGMTYQPQLKNFIASSFSREIVSKKLNDVYIKNC